VLHAKKRFGQHFLHDPHIISDIVACIHPRTDQRFLEIGPGHGELTNLLVDRVKQIDVIELDRDLIPGLLTLAKQKTHLQVYQADILKFDLETLHATPYSLRVVGNLPYNISTPILFYLLEHKDKIHDIHVMLQAEVVDRMAAPPGEKSYGRLSVMLQYYCDVEKLLFIPPEAFNPPPKVDSAIVRLNPYKSLPYLAKDEALLARIVQQAFSQRRKMLRNTLKIYLSTQDFEHLNISPLSRAEEISVENYVKISNYLVEKGA
jgi:16S rRNA (adenine1518-N6/adenine1519-N6)-dimethyltransferase